jgi:hypothetical protein
VYRNGYYLATTKNTSFVNQLYLPGVYNWSIQTVDSKGQRSFRSESTSTTDYLPGTPPNANDNTPPTVPDDLSAATVGNKQVSLTWDASTDSGPGPIGYTVLRNNKPIAMVSTPGYLDTLAKVGTYTYTVMAYDGWGNHVTSAGVVGDAEKATGP